MDTKGIDLNANFPTSKMDPWLTVMPSQNEIYLGKLLPNEEYVRFLVLPTGRTMIKMGKRGGKVENGRRTGRAVAEFYENESPN